MGKRGGKNRKPHVPVHGSHPKPPHVPGAPALPHLEKKKKIQKERRQEQQGRHDQTGQRDRAGDEDVEVALAQDQPLAQVVLEHRPQHESQHSTWRGGGGATAPSFGLNPIDPHSARAAAPSYLSGAFTPA